ncbi:MAG: hypothetical protein AAF307_12650 [Pseudomonadota bacterium]
MADTNVPAGFGLENEHPKLAMPFTVRLGDARFEGKRLSITDLEIEAAKGTLVPGSKDIATVSFPFEDFTINLTAQLTATDQGDGDTSVLLFSEPTGAHLAQLRYIINSFIAGDIITLKGLMAYSGPTQPKAPKGAEAKPVGQRIRSIAVAIASLMIAFLAAGVVFSRYTSAYELYPVFIAPQGQSMQATVAGQVTYLNPDAPPGEVAYTIAANTGDVLSFQMPQSGDVALGSQIYEGATVLPTDLILTILDPNASLRLTTLISIEGLTRALQGDPASLELADGRTLPVQVNVRDVTQAAALRGDLYVPVDLTVTGGSLGPSDTNLTGRLRLSKSLLGVLGFGRETRSE